MDTILCFACQQLDPARTTFAETEIPVRYRGGPEHLAVMAVWLASPLARNITGTVIPQL